MSTILHVINTLFVFFSLIKRIKSCKVHPLVLQIRRYSFYLFLFSLDIVFWRLIITVLKDFSLKSQILEVDSLAWLIHALIGFEKLYYLKNWVRVLNSDSWNLKFHVRGSFYLWRITKWQEARFIVLFLVTLILKLSRMFKKMKDVGHCKR